MKRLVITPELALTLKLLCALESDYCSDLLLALLCEIENDCDPDYLAEPVRLAFDYWKTKLNEITIEV